MDTCLEMCHVHSNTEWTRFSFFFSFFFLSLSSRRSLCIAPTPNAMSGANITLMVDWALNTKVLPCRSPRPDITVMVDWMLNTKLLSGRSPRPNISVKWLTGR